MSALLSADDLNDFISPGAACIKPPTETVPAEGTGLSKDGEVEVQFDQEGNALEVGKDGTTSNLSAAQISLADCLACSGCITSAEEILVAQHSHNELIKALSSSNKQFVASISHQSRASLATAFNLSVEQIDRLLINLFINQMGFKAVVGTSLGRKLSLISESFNTIQKKELGEEGPTFSSICPGWVLYAEKTHPYILPKLSDVKSPQQITGCLLKNLVASDLNVNKSEIYHLSIMPCFDKKLESARPEKEGDTVNDVDCVLTAKELVTLLSEQLDRFRLIPKNANEIMNSLVPVTEIYKKVAPNDWPLVEFSWANDIGSASGGYSENYLNLMKSHLLLKEPGVYREEGFHIKQIHGKNLDVYEMRLMHDDQKIASAAVVNGFRNIQNLIRKFKPNANNKAKVNPLAARRRARAKPKEKEEEEEVADASKCDYVEIMACPNGCINGGGQISNPQEILEKDWLVKALENYDSIPTLDLSAKQISPSLVSNLVDWTREFSTQFSVSESRLLRTWFKEVEKPTDPNAILLGAKW